MGRNRRRARIQRQEGGAKGERKSPVAKAGKRKVQGALSRNRKPSRHTMRQPHPYERVEHALTVALSAPQYDAARCYETLAQEIRSAFRISEHDKGYEALGDYVCTELRGYLTILGRRSDAVPRHVWYSMLRQTLEMIVGLEGRTIFGAPTGLRNFRRSRHG